MTPLELTGAYAAFANGGYRVYALFRHRSRYRRQAGLSAPAPRTPQRIIAEQVDRDLIAMLYGVVASGTGGGASLHGREAAGKTGTTQDSATTPGSWASPPTMSPPPGWAMTIPRPPAASPAAPCPPMIWRDAMLAAEQGLPLKPLDKSVQPPPDERCG